jgi:predicted nucleotidyltransferase component of viral defense system
MIPKAFIAAWRTQAPWSSDAYVEQDLILSRAIIEIFSDPFLRERLAFRGGTALQKVYLKEPVRYSEDIDLVQRRAEPIGPVINAIRIKLDAWLGRPRWELARANASLVYRFNSEIAPVEPLRLKVETNTREHFSVLGYQPKTLTVDNPWFKGSTELVTYELEELMGTKMRALYQRQKGRDLYDLHYVLDKFPKLDCQKVVQCFQKYLAHENREVSRAQFEANMHEKMSSKRFKADIHPILHPDQIFEMDTAYTLVHEALIARLPGEAWKGTKKTRKS